MEEGKSLLTRSCILDAAQRLFASHGYHGASIRDIAHACGVSNAALYYHFGSKQKLYSEVLGEYVAAVVSELEKADPGRGPVRHRLTCVALAYARIILESQNVLQTLMRDVAQLDQADVVRRLSDWSDRVPATIGAILEQAIAAGELRPVPLRRTGTLLLGMISAVTARRLYTQVETTPEQDVDLVMDVLFEGIAVWPNPLEAVSHE
jgi:AcrR family transcriptional regulator